MKYEEALRMQKRLDEEVVNCPKCNSKVRWWEIKEFGSCFNCYSSYYKQDEDNGTYDDHLEEIKKD